MRKWLEIRVFVPREQQDNVALVFHEAGSGGVVIEDPAFVLDCIREGNKETVAPKLGRFATGETVVKGYFACDDETMPERLENLYRTFDEHGLRRETGYVREEDWATAWQAYYKPVRVGRRLVVKPSWEEYTAGPGDVVIEMDPGMAFGCGTHATTAMCMEFLEERIRGGETVCDVGTGSGILAVTAALLGARRVIAVDIDELAVRTARENAARNGVADRVAVLHGDLLDKVSGVKVDIMVANIIAGVVIRLLPAAVSVLEPGGLLVVSGIIRQRGEDVLRALRGAGLKTISAKSRGEWLAFGARC